MVSKKRHVRCPGSKSADSYKISLIVLNLLFRVYMYSMVQSWVLLVWSCVQTGWLVQYFRVVWVLSGVKMCSSVWYIARSHAAACSRTVWPYAVEFGMTDDTICRCWLLCLYTFVSALVQTLTRLLLDTAFFYWPKVDKIIKRDIENSSQRLATRHHSGRWVRGRSD